MIITGSGDKLWVIFGCRIAYCFRIYGRLTEKMPPGETEPLFLWVIQQQRRPEL